MTADGNDTGGMHAADAGGGSCRALAPPTPRARPGAGSVPVPHWGGTARIFLPCWLDDGQDELPRPRGRPGIGVETRKRVRLLQKPDPCLLRLCISVPTQGP